MADREASFKVPFQLGNARSRIVRGHCISGEYRIDLAVPAGSAPSSGWPVAVLLDAAGCFATCVEAVGRMGRRPDATGVAPLVVIGVSACGNEMGPDRRRRDFTSATNGHSANDDPGIGGASGFAQFLEEEVLPLVAAEVPIDPRQRTLFGHSLAGYFTLWVLANRPDLFHAYAAISPSIWWDREGLLAAWAKLHRLDRRALILLGEWEERLPPWQMAHPGHERAAARRAERHLGKNARTAAAALADLLGEAQVRFELLADEDHASIVSAAIVRMLRMASIRV